MSIHIGTLAPLVALAAGILILILIVIGILGLIR